MTEKPTLAELMVKRFGPGEVIKVKPHFILKAEKFCRKLEKAFVSTVNSKLRFK